MASTEEKRELVTKLTRHVASRFGGTSADAWARAFAAYDGNGDSRIDRLELEALLDAAGIGNFLTIGAWVSGVMDEVDTSHDGGISSAELLQVLKTAPASTSPVYAQATKATARPDYLFPLTYTPSKPPAAAPAPARKLEPVKPERTALPWILAGVALLVLLTRK